MTLLRPDFLPGGAQTFQAVRHLLEKTGLREGVAGVEDLRATQKAAGADRSVDVAAGSAWVAPNAGDPGTRRGLYHLVNDGTVNVPSSANTGNPRVVRLYAKVNDPAFDASSSPQLLVVAGSSQAAATLDNAAGATSRAAIVVPAASIALAEWLEPTGYTQILNADIRGLREPASGVSEASSYVAASEEVAVGDGVLRALPTLAEVAVLMPLDGLLRIRAKMRANKGNGATGRLAVFVDGAQTKDATGVGAETSTAINDSDFYITTSSPGPFLVASAGPTAEGTLAVGGVQLEGGEIVLWGLRPGRHTVALFASRTQQFLLSERRLWARASRT